MSDEHSSATRVQLAAAELDPQLQVASAPFATWIGTIQVDASGDALLLRGSGDEDRIVTHAEHAHLIEQALEAAGAPVLAGTGTWLPLRQLYPVLAHLDAREAFDVASRMPAPRVEHVGLGRPSRPLVLRAALIDGEPGWCGAVTDEPLEPA